MARQLVSSGSSFERDIGFSRDEAADFERCWPVLREHFGEIRPAATMIVAALVDPRIRIEIEVTARRRNA